MASFNPERAEVPLALPDGRTLKLVLDYQAVGAMIAKLGEKWDVELAKGFSAYDCPKICDALAILAARHHPELTADDFMAASPAWTTAINAIEAAQTLFLFGHVGPPPREPKENGDPEDGEEVPFANGQDGAKSSSRLWPRLFRRVYGQRSSGP